jgi:hypothetical protein
MLVDVETTSGVYLASVLEETPETYKVRYLVYRKKGIYDYEDVVEEIEKDAVCGVYDPEDTEEAAGFVRVEGGFVPKDDDDEYEPSDTEDDGDDENESLVSEDEES